MAKLLDCTQDPSNQVFMGNTDVSAYQLRTGTVPIIDPYETPRHPALLGHHINFISFLPIFKTMRLQQLTILKDLLPLLANQITLQVVHNHIYPITTI
jgi:hypothetical protein